MSGLTLGIESSCDETSAALLGPAGDVRSLIIHSQDVHRIYGGVVPELAARAHLTQIDAVVDRALTEGSATGADVGLVAVTAGPGLIGALLVGVGWAKAFAARHGLPVVGVHHMEAHLFGPLLDHPDLEPPLVALLVSGGHTMLLHVREWGAYELLGQTRDDAAGEAFDKVAKTMDLPYPGGPAIARLAEQGDGAARRLPRPLLKGPWDPEGTDAFDFSFSGLKTATALWVQELRADGVLETHRADVAAAFQEAVVDVLVAKTVGAAEHLGVSTIAIAGGVAVNRRLRERLVSEVERMGPSGRVLWASPRFSLDNGAMIARAGQFRFARDGGSPDTLTAQANLPFPGLTVAEFSPA